MALHEGPDLVLRTLSGTNPYAYGGPHRQGDRRPFGQEAFTPMKGWVIWTWR